MHALPTRQEAVQLIAPGELRLNPDKVVHPPGPHQVLCRVEVVGLCFSDLKLLKQFSGHVRKSVVIAGIEPGVLESVPSYVPGDRPTVPGHEAVVTVLQAGEAVEGLEPGARYLVQADYRWLKTAQSNAAFGYNFEGALQHLVLIDQRVITSPEGASMLIPVDPGLPASAVALVEPWACVEHAYVTAERRSLKEGGRLLVVTGGRPVDEVVETFLSGQPAPGEVLDASQGIEGLADESLDDILFFGADPELLEALFPKMAKGGLCLVVQDGERFGRPVVAPVGRIHYGGLRMVGTAGGDPAEALAAIPPNGEIRAGDRIDVVGAGGPMGTMHVIRNLCQGVPDVSVFGGDTLQQRLDVLERLAQPLAAQHGIAYEGYLASSRPGGDFDYTALMVPVPALVEEAIGRGAQNGIINVFAGIPAEVSHPLDLDRYVARQLYMIGTSGSVIGDMHIVLAKVTAGTLDTNLSVAAVAGMEGALDGLSAVEHQALPGKIIIYPSCKGLPLTPLTGLAETLPGVAAALEQGAWTPAAERTLLEAFASAGGEET